MCEPNHSFVQYPPNNDGNTPTEVLLQPSIGKRILELGKKVLGWLHYSKLGKGHSEAIRTLGVRESLIPEETRYEARWWDRTVILDGMYNGESVDKNLALEAATGYAQAVSIGSLTALRNFLEVSMRKSERPGAYVDVVLSQLLKPEGRDIAARKLRSAMEAKTNLFYNFSFGKLASTEAVDKAIKVILGLTRRRSLLVDAWADDGRLWTPGQVGMEGKPSLIM